MADFLQKIIDDFSQVQHAPNLDAETISKIQALDALQLANQIKCLISTTDLAVLTHFLKYLVSLKNDGSLWEMLGNLYFKQSNWCDAHLAYRKALAVNSSALGAHFGLAQVEQQMQKYSEAKHHLDIILKEMPEQVIALFQLGCCLLQLEEIDAAEEKLKLVLQLSPYHLEALINLGTCAIKKQDYQQAICYFSTAIRVDENHLAARSNLANCLYGMDRYLEAKNHYQLYLELAPRDADAWFKLGHIEVHLKEFKAAKKALHKALSFGGDNAAILHNLALIALEESEPSVAIGYYQRALALDAQDDIAKYMIASLCGEFDIPAIAPAAYVKTLFDNYAARFDNHLNGQLHYQTPQLLKSLWLQYQEGAAKPCHVGHLLDLGCGTGLAAEQFKECADYIVGVDLSPNMLAVAKEKKLYDLLIESDILHYIAAIKEPFDLIVLADVLVYFGKLEPLIRQLAKKMPSGSQLLLSIESQSKQDYCLTQHARYQHRPDYLMRLLLACGLKHLASRNAIIRCQEDKPVDGYLLLCGKL